MASGSNHYAVEGIGGLRITKRCRHLTNHQETFSQNAWDDFEWNKDMIQKAEERLKVQLDEANSMFVGDNDLETDANERRFRIESKSEQSWEEFYKTHQDRFFKDRRWIFSEFPELLEYMRQNSRECHILEVGSGVGNAVIPIVEKNKNELLFVYCCDISAKAIETLKKNPIYDKNRITAIKMDLTKSWQPLDEVIPRSLNFVTMIFVLSAIQVDQMFNVVSNLVEYMTEGGIILFRDYAKYDMTQLRFKGRSRLAENYYVRGDGTTTYFFTEDYVDSLFTKAGLTRLELNTDRRLLCNRAKSIKMCRCWIQAKYCKK